MRTLLHPMLVAGTIAAAQAAPLSTVEPVANRVLNTHDSGYGSLRETIRNLTPGDSVRFAPSLAGTILLTSGEIVIDKPLKIEAPGAPTLTISGANLSRLFRVTASSVFISGLGLTEGRVLGRNGADGFGVGWDGEPGESVLGGALLNTGELTVSNCNLFSNAVRGGQGGNGSGDARFFRAGSGGLGGTGGGGAIGNMGTLKLVNCAFISNASEGGSGGDGGPGFNEVTGVGGSGRAGGAGLGGAIHSQGSLEALGCAFYYNTTSSGSGGKGAAGRGFGGGGGQGGSALGGAVNSDATFGLFNCNLSYNGAVGAVGGAAGDGASGSLPGGRGGSAYGGGGSGPGTLVHCTLVKNMVAGGDGGVAPDPGFNGTVGLSIGGGLRSLGAGLINSAIALNVLIDNPGEGPDVVGVVRSSGHNLIGIGGGSSGWRPTDLVGATTAPRDPLLGPLTYYGGPASIMVPRPGSPLIEAGDNTVLGPPFNLALDQRGGPRRAFAQVDIGAIEVGSEIQIVKVLLNASGIDILVTTEAGFPQHLESTDSLTSGEWAPVGPAGFLGHGGQMSRSDPRPRAASHRFYRTVLSRL